MIKALSAVALGAFVAAGITVLLGFAPKVEASVTAPLGKSDGSKFRKSAATVRMTGFGPIPASARLATRF
jgi:hypothetical protein